MEKNDKETSQQKKRFFFRSFLWCVLSTVLAVFAVLFFSILPFRVDLTSQKLFSLSDSTLETLSQLAAPVRIAAVYPDGNPNMMVASLLEAYARSSGKIELNFVDAEKDPGLLAGYDLGDAGTVTRGTIIVNSQGRRKLVYESDMFFEGTTGNQFYGERIITGAIRYVGSNVLPRVYFVVGHGERGLQDKMINAAELLQTDVWEVLQLPLLQQDRIPEDAGVLVFANPVQDLDESEVRILLSYLSGGGSMLLLLDPAASPQNAKLPLFEAIAGLYGIGIINNYVIEEDTSYYYTTNNLYLIPRFAAHPITQSIVDQKKMVILPLCRGISQLPESSSDVKTSALLMSSNKSRARMDMNIPNPGAAPSDILGPIPLAYAATKEGPELGIRSSRLVVVGDSDFVMENNVNAQANGDFFLNTMNWLLGGRETEIIAGKTINADLLMIRGRDFIRLAIICCAVIPLIFFLAAFVNWLQNRNR
jgi:ABC-2 type transport system permease protein